MATLDAYERLVSHHSVTIDTKFRTQADQNIKNACLCPVPEMHELAPLIVNRIGLVYAYDNGTAIFTLQDAELVYTVQDQPPTHLALLINTVDKNGSTTVVKNTQTKKRTEIEPKHEQGEGYEVSIHIVISLNGQMRTYDMLITSTPKVSTGRIASYLNRILFEVARANEKKFTSNTLTNEVSGTSKENLKILYKPVFDITGMLDKELFNKLSNKGLSDVILIKDEFDVITAPDMNSPYIPTESRLKILPNHGNDVIGWLVNVASYFNSDINGGYDKLKVVFEDPDTNKPRHVDFKTSNINLNNLEKTFIKKSILSGFASRLKDSYDTIEPEFINKMIDIL